MQVDPTSTDLLTGKPVERALTLEPYGVAVLRALASSGRRPLRGATTERAHRGAPSLTFSEYRIRKRPPG